MEEKRETKGIVLMKRRTLLIIVEVILLLIICVCIVLEYNKRFVIKEVAIVENENNGAIINTGDEKESYEYKETLDIEKIDVTKNSKTEVVNEDEDYYKVTKDGKWGVIDGNGNLVIDIKYNSIRIINNSLLYIDKKEIIDFSGKHIADSVIDVFDAWSDADTNIADNRFMFYNGELKGVKDEKGNIILPAKFTEIVIPYISNSISTSEELESITEPIKDVILAKEGEVYTLYDYNGNVIVDNVLYFLDNYAVLNNGSDIVTADGRITECFENGIAIVLINDKKGFYFFKSNRFIQPEEYEYVKCKTVEELDYKTYVECFDKENKLVKIYDEKGNEIPISQYKCAIIIDEKDGKYALLDRRNDKLITEYEYNFYKDNSVYIENTNIYIDYNRGIAATVNLKNNIITLFNLDNNGEKIAKYNYDGDYLEKWTYKIYCNNKYKVIMNEKGLYGIINKEGKEIIPFEYEKIVHFDCFDNIFILKKQGHDVLINIENNIKTDKYILDTFEAGLNIYHPNCFGLKGYTNIYGRDICVIDEEKGYFLAKDKEKNKYCVLDKEFKEVVEPLYSNIELWNGNIKICLGFDTKYGMLDKEFNEIVKPIYNYIDLNGELAIIGLNGNTGLINAEGKELLSCIYDEIEIKEYRGYNKGKYIKATLRRKLDNKSKFKLFHIESNMNIKEFNFGDNVEIVDMIDFNNIIVKKDGKMAYVVNSAYVTDFLYDEIELCGFYAKVVIGNKWGVIDKNGNTIIELGDRYIPDVWGGIGFIGKWMFTWDYGIGFFGADSGEELEYARENWYK